jgi:hypothetical protein
MLCYVFAVLRYIAVLFLLFSLARLGMDSVL